MPALTTGQAVTVKGAGCFNPVNCKVATGDSANTVEAAPAVDSVKSQSPVLTTATALQPGNTQAEDGSNEASQQTSSAEQASESDESVPVIIYTTPAGSRPTTKPSSGLGAIIAGAFGPRPSSSQDSSGGQPSDVEGTQTLATGNPPVVISGSTISLAPTASAIGVDGDTDILPGQADTVNPAPVITIGSQEITISSASQYIVESQTLAAGSSAIVVSGSTYSLAPSASAIIVNGATSSLLGGVAPTDVAPVITVGGEAVTMNSASELIVGSQTLAPGSAQIEVSGTTFSLAPSASAIVINGVTSALPAFNSDEGAATAGSGVLPAITIGGQPITANSASAYIIGSQTLAPGNSAIVLSGMTYSLAPSVSAIVVNGVTSALPAYNSDEGQATAGSGGLPAITIGGQPITANSASEYIINSQTLAPGSSAIIVSGTTYSLASSASAIVINGVTSALPSTATTTNGAQVITIGSQLFTARPISSGSGYLVGSQTLVPGASGITVNGLEVSLAPGASSVVVGGTTEGFEAPTGVGGNSTGFDGVAFTGGAMRVGVGLMGQMLAMGLGMFGLIIL